MTRDLPVASVARRPDRWDGPDRWDSIAPLPPLLLADGSGPALQQTSVRLCWDDAALHLRFDCDDRDIWGTYRERDDPLYDEEVVELFIAVGEATPKVYYEVEVSPLGAIYDTKISSPNGDRNDMVGDTAWDCDGLQPQIGRREGGWWAEISVPWASIGAAGAPDVCRANLYRIERPRGEEPEFSCWSPTLTDPADFHRAGRFGTLRLAHRA